MEKFIQSFLKKKLDTHSRSTTWHDFQTVIFSTFISHLFLQEFYVEANTNMLSGQPRPRSKI